MRSAAGIAGVTLLLVAAGQGLLLALGFTRLRVRTLLASAGLAYLAGVVACMLIGILLLVVGITFDLTAFLLVALLLAAGGTALAVRRGVSTQALGAAVGEPVRPPYRWIVRAGVALLGVFLLIGLWDATQKPLAEWDGWSIWTRKAVVLANSGLDPHVFASMPYSFAHLDYPLLMPLFESLHFRAMGVVDGQAIHVALWILFVAFLGAIAYLGSRMARFYLWFPVVIAVALASQVYSELLSAYVDVEVGLFAAPGMLCLGLWLRGRDWRRLALAALLLAGAASVKNEGLLLMLSAYVALGLVLVFGRSWRRLLHALAAGAFTLLLIAPWRLWTASHDISSDLPISKGLTPSYLIDRSDRIVPSLKALLSQLESGSLLYLVPVALGIVVVGLATARARQAAAFYLLAALGSLVSVIWAYMITTATLAYQIGTSATRVVMGVTFVSVAAILHVGGLLDDELPEPATDPPAPQPADRPLTVLPDTARA